MKIYMRDGYRMTIKSEDPSLLEADFGFKDGYVLIKKWDHEHKNYFTKMIIPKESLVFIQFDRYENDTTEMIIGDY